MFVIFQKKKKELSSFDTNYHPIAIKLSISGSG